MFNYFQKFSYSILQDHLGLIACYSSFYTFQYWAIQVLRNADGVGGIKFSGETRYEDVKFNDISDTREWEGSNFQEKKRYITLEWPLFRFFLHFINLFNNKICFDCCLQVSAKPVFVPGVWGPYYSAMIPGLFLSEGGQSATGKLVSEIRCQRFYWIENCYCLVDICLRWYCKEMLSK